MKGKNDVESKTSEDKLFSGLLSAMMFAGKDRECPACPIFIEKLRESPDLSDSIKKMMKGGS